ncbi:MAG TPA: hypothetical protein VF540_05530, partial [Segetibacter sp.]
MIANSIEISGSSLVPIAAYVQRLRGNNGIKIANSVKKNDKCMKKIFLAMVITASMSMGAKAQSKFSIGPTAAF